jgi:pilus assembly protein CpaF
MSWDGSGTSASAGAKGAMDGSPEAQFALATERAQKRVSELVDLSAAASMPRRMLAAQISVAVGEVLDKGDIRLDLSAQRDLVSYLLDDIVENAKGKAPSGPVPAPSPAAQQQPGASTTRNRIDDARRAVQPMLMERLDIGAASQLPRKELVAQISDVVGEIVAEERLKLNLMEQRELVSVLIDDMLGLGPLEPLLADETITDIMVNGAKQVYIERKGKLELSSAVFRDNSHVMNVATRIVSRIGRRVDESTPLVDARLEDGSRVNIIIPPLAIDGPAVSIRKFSKKSITLDVMVRQRNMAEDLGKVLKIAAACRLNVVISGGTGSGKTTMLNAMSQLIDPAERVVTIEDAAELQLQQPHVVRLETRPPNLEGTGEITMRDLVKNALRMRPDRIICGEVRGAEALDMLQAMNTGHDGSMCTLHANNPREALTRMENMIGMAAVNLPSKAVRTQIVGAVNLIVQVQRMRDGVRRVTHVTEVIGMEGEVITTQDLFTFEFQGENRDGTLIGHFKSSGVRPHFSKRAAYFGLERALQQAMMA